MGLRKAILFTNLHFPSQSSSIEEHLKGHANTDGYLVEWSQPMNDDGLDGMVPVAN